VNILYEKALFLAHILIGRYWVNRYFM